MVLVMLLLLLQLLHALVHNGRASPLAPHSTHQLHITQKLVGLVLP